jgi:hypothetical protein
MGNYANIKARRFVKFLKWLEKNKGIDLSCGGRHNYKVTCIFTGDSFPVPSSHDEINKYIVKDFRDWLMERDLCTEEEYDHNL